MNRFKETVYKLIDTATLGRGIRRTIGGAEIQLPSRLSRYFKPDYEPETVEYLRAALSPGDIFFDIGAHIGLFTVLGARLVGDGGKVVSFEPTRATRRALNDVVKANGYSKRVVIRPEAVAEARGTAQFFDTGDAISVTNSLVHDTADLGSIEIPTISVDDFVSESGLEPSLMKIDVEGAELAVLRGAQKTLNDIRPAMRLSLHPPFHPKDANILTQIWEILDSAKYKADLDGRPVDGDWFCSQTGFVDVNLTAA